jgi:Cd2+/Zn2+-exporting ATPase
LVDALDLEMTSRPKLQFRIVGMDCAEEVSILKREVGPLVGGEDKLSFDILTAKMTVSGSEGMNTGTIVSAVARTGMQAEPWTDPSDRKTQANRWQDHARTITTGVSGICSTPDHPNIPWPERLGMQGWSSRCHASPQNETQ